MDAAKARCRLPRRSRPTSAATLWCSRTTARSRCGSPTYDAKTAERPSMPLPRHPAERLPPDATLDEARAESAGCRACDLWRHATQTVFGEGAVKAPIVLVGEQPGDQEDIAGRPFIGPAGREL